MSQRVLAPARPPALEEAVAGPTPDDVAIAASARARPRVRAWWLWAAAAVLLLAGSAALVVWARTLPSFDAYGWLTWGQRTWHGGLDTNAAPSWKPLPYVFTAVYALVGHHAELRLWMTTSAAVGIAGAVFVGRLAYRLTAPPPGRAWTGWVAAAVAGLALLLLRDELGYGYLHYVLSSQSDPMIVAFVLAAVELAWSGRPRAAFVCAVLASLGRPEAWPLLALYSLWLWREQPATRRLLVAGWFAVAALWFGIPALTSRTPFVSAANALDSGRAPSGDRVTAVISRFGSLQCWAVYVAAALCVAGAAMREWSARRTSSREVWARRGAAAPHMSRTPDRVALGLAAGIVVWVAIEVAFGLHGWPALGRYMFEPAAAATVLAGAFAGRALTANWSTIASRLGSRIAGLEQRPGLAVAAVGPVLVALLIAALVPFAISSARQERSDLTEQHARTAEIEALPAAVDRLGGPATVRACGEPLTRLQYQSALAFALGDNVSQVGFKYSQALAHGNPVLFVTPFPSGVGWQVQAAHQTAPACRPLPTTPTTVS
ncbi:MAG TPA: hypothetical protein VFW09_11605 [Solirubrobacteraceae bacterium]|nr:hypothetical protein [Solirubrobacteraceae bacterium]